MAKIKRENLEEHLLEKQFNYIQLTVLDAAFTKDWPKKWTLTKKQHEDWKTYCIYTIKKVCKINRTKAIATFEYLNGKFGLKIKG